MCSERNRASVMRILTRLTRRGSASVTSNSMPSSTMIFPAHRNMPRKCSDQPSKVSTSSASLIALRFGLDHPGDFAKIGTRIYKEPSTRNGFDLWGFRPNHVILDVADDHFHDISIDARPSVPHIRRSRVPYGFSSPLHFHEKVREPAWMRERRGPGVEYRPAIKPLPIRSARRSNSPPLRLRLLSR